MKINKRGSHVGVVLSFVVFITFLIFLYSVMEPSIKIQKDKQSLLDYLERELIEKFSANMTIFTLTIKEECSQNCIEIENLMNVEGITTKMLVKNESESLCEAYISGEGSSNLLIKRGDSENKFFKIYCSEESETLESSTIHPCGNLGEEDYAFGLTRMGGYIFETKITELIEVYGEIYGEGYENLKEELKIPAGSEFGFSFTYSDGAVEGTEEKEVLTSVYVEEIPIQYIDEKANINSGFLNIKVW